MNGKLKIQIGAKSDAASWNAMVVGSSSAPSKNSCAGPSPAMKSGRGARSNYVLLACSHCERSKILGENCGRNHKQQ